MKKDKVTITWSIPPLLCDLKIANILCKPNQYMKNPEFSKRFQDHIITKQTQFLIILFFQTEAFGGFPLP